MTITRITAVLLLAACAARGQIAHRWLAEASRTAPQEIAVYRGETLALEPTVTVHGEAYAWPDGTAVTLYWQTNGMAASWWSAPAALGAETGALRAVWSPACDAGADRYTFFIRAAAPSGTAYRASGTLRMLASPGAVPNALALPVPSIDFSGISVLNPPWVTADDWQSGSNALASALQPIGPRLDAVEAWPTNDWRAAYSWGDHTLAGYLLPAALAPYATTQQVAAAVSPLGPRIAALEGGTNAWQTAYAWGDHALAGYLLPADLSPYATTQQVAAATDALYLRSYHSAGLEGGLYWDVAGGLRLYDSWLSAALVLLDTQVDAPAAATRKDYVDGLAADRPTASQMSGVVAAATNALVQTHLLGSNAWMIVSNDVLRIWQLSPTNSLQTNLLWQSGDAFPAAATQTLWTAILQLTQDLDAKGGRAWGQYAPDGAANPDPAYMTFLNSPATVYASGAQWSTYGTYAVLTVTGTVAFASGEDGQFRIGPNSTNWFGYLQGGSVTVGAVADSLAVTGGGQTGGYAEIVYPYAGGDFPALWFTPSLALDFTEVSGAVWVDNLDGTATATAPAESAAGFWYATTTSVVDNYFKTTMPARFDGGVVGSTNAVPVVYDSTITISSGGKNYRIPAQEVE